MIIIDETDHTTARSCSLTRIAHHDGHLVRIRVSSEYVMSLAVTAVLEILSAQRTWTQVLTTVAVAEQRGHVRPSMTIQQLAPVADDLLVRAERILGFIAHA